MKNKRTKKPKSSVKKSIVRAKVMSAKNIQDLRKLAEQIGEVIPATTFPGTGFCFKNIARGYRLGKFWPAHKKGLGKKESIFLFLREVYKKHRKIFYKIFRENLARGIERRKNNGQPVIEAEILELNSTLLSLGVNLEAEIRALNLPKDRPTVVAPPHEFKVMIDKMGLHPFLMPECVKRYKDGYFNDAVRKALEKYEVYIQKKSAQQAIGTDLMGSVLSEKNPKIRIADIGTKRGLALQDGFKLLSMGAMGFWRNFLSHGDEKQVSPQDGLSLLGIVSHMLNVIDNGPGDPVLISLEETATKKEGGSNKPL